MIGGLHEEGSNQMKLRLRLGLRLRQRPRKMSGRVLLRRAGLWVVQRML